MIISQLMLTAFMVKWIIDRFSQEKEILRKELMVEFRSAEHIVMDSLMLNMIQFQQPLVNPNQISSLSVNAFQSPIKKDKNTDTLAVYGVPQSKSRAVISITTKSSNASDTVKLNQKELEKIRKATTEGFLASKDFTKQVVRGINQDDKNGQLQNQNFKIFIDSKDDQKNNKSVKWISFGSTIDTSILVKIFNEKTLGLNLANKWGIIDINGNVDNNELMFTSRLFDNNYGVQVQDYSLFIARRLTSNILIALLIISITVVAFVLSYRNLKKQYQLNSIRNEFVGNITHELKTPVATVKIALETLLSYNVISNRQKAEEYINLAVLETNRLETLIQKVLSLGIQENPKSFLNIETINLHEAVKDALNSLSIRIDQAEGEVNLKVIGDNFQINADSIHLQGVINSLLDNSLKYTTSKPEITIILEEQKSSLSLQISDTGMGIPDEYLSKVFEKFFRVPTGDKHNIKGYGLGLSYALSVMKQLKGSISVKNNQGLGCTFTLTFPKVER
jgi:signal transduction histidine kinase